MSSKAELITYMNHRFGEAGRKLFAAFEVYYRWLLEENQRVNLISRKTDPDTIWIRHFLDSLLAVECVDFEGKNILDVGTGGGFPGVPLAILFPAAHVTLLDSTKKKIQSVKTGVAELHLTNCSFLDMRLEEVPATLSGTFDRIVCRSVKIIPAYKKHLLRLLKDDGELVLYKSRNLDDVAQFTKVHSTEVGNSRTGERKIVVIKKSENI